MRSAKFSRGRALSLTLAATLAVGALTVVAAPSQAASSKLTLSPATGKGLAGTPATNVATSVITVTGSGFTDANGNSLLGTSSATANVLTASLGATAVQFNTATTCPAQAVTADGVTSTNVLAQGDTHSTTEPSFTVVSGTKLVITVPSLPLTVTGGVYSAKAYSLCIYDNGTAAAASPANVTAVGTTLIGQSTYTVYPQPTVTSISPTQGSITGGTTVTVVGTNLTTKTTASINGVALTNVKVAKDLKSLTGTVPATSSIPKVTSRIVLTNVAYAYPLVVSTEGGPSSNGGPTYTYVNAVTVTPKLATAGTAAVITVDGKGFTTILNPTTGTPATNAKVLIVPGQFNSTETVATYFNWPWKSGSATGYTDAALLTAFACTNVKVVSDTQLTCAIPATLASGPYTVTLVDDVRTPTTGGGTLSYQTIPSSSATLTVAAF